MGVVDIHIQMTTIKEPMFYINKISQKLLFMDGMSEKQYINTVTQSINCNYALYQRYLFPR